jgi:uncharacterized membrane protein
MNRIESIIFWIAFAVIVLGLTGGLIAVGASRHTTCQYWSWERGDWKTVSCQERPHVRQSKPATAEPTETATPEWATATDEPWEPWSTDVPPATNAPYPTQERTPYP